MVLEVEEPGGVDLRLGEEVVGAEEEGQEVEGENYCVRDELAKIEVQILVQAHNVVSVGGLAPGRATHSMQCDVCDWRWSAQLWTGFS